MPGIAASTKETCVLGAPPNSVAAPEKSFALEATWAWTSRPMTTSQSPVLPLIRLPALLLLGSAMASSLPPPHALRHPAGDRCGRRFPRLLRPGSAFAAWRGHFLVDPCLEGGGGVGQVSSSDCQRPGRP